MCFMEGQGILGRTKFKDGSFPTYDRTYLIVNVFDDYIEVLNVSSLKGKERKLAFPANKRIHLFNPPFLKPSFVKLDSLSRIYKDEWSGFKLLCKGDTMNCDELLSIKTKLNEMNM